MIETGRKKFPSKDLHLMDLCCRGIKNIRRTCRFYSSFLIKVMLCSMAVCVFSRNPVINIIIDIGRVSDKDLSIPDIDNELANRYV